LLILSKGISQEELARMIGTQRSNICRLESGAQNLTVDMLIKITAALGKVCGNADSSLFCVKD